MSIGNDSGWHFFWVATFVAVVCFVSYGLTLVNTFVLDDVQILAEVIPLDLSQLPELCVKPVYGDLIGQYRPLTFLTFALDYAAWGSNPVGYHLTNLGLAILCAWLVAVLAMRVFHARWPWAVALLFASLPGHSEAVISIYNRSQLLATGGMLTALLCFDISLRAFKPQRYFLLAAACCTFGSCLAKENALVTPLLCVLVFLWHRPQVIQRHTFAYGMAMQTIAVLGYLALRYRALGMISMPGVEPYLAGATMTQWYFTVTKTFTRYLMLSFLPIGLSADYVTSRVSFHLPGLIYPWIGLWACYHLWRHTRFALVALAFLWFVLALAPVLHLIPLQVMIAERFLYSATPATCLVLAWLLALRPGWGKGLLLAILVCSMATTAHRCCAWKTNEILWQQTLRTTPQSFRAHLYFGTQAARQGNWSLALATYEKAQQCNPNQLNRIKIYYNRAIVFRAQGLTNQARDSLLAILQLAPQYAPALVLLGRLARGDEVAALRYFYQARQGRPLSRQERAELLEEIGDCHYSQGWYGEAHRDYQDSLRDASTRWRLFLKLGMSAYYLHHDADAKAYFFRALVSPAHAPSAHEGLALLYEREQQPQQAAYHRQRAQQLRKAFRAGS